MMDEGLQDKLFFLTYLLDSWMGFIDGEDIQPALVQIAEHGFTDDIYNSAFCQKILSTKTSDFDDLYARLCKRVSNAPPIVTEMLEDTLYDIARKKCPPVNTLPEERR